MKLLSLLLSKKVAFGLRRKMKILFATHNNHKVSEIKNMLLK